MTPPRPTPNDREPGQAGVVGRVVAALAAALTAGAIGPAAGVATAQAPGLERFARQPETPLELWNAISYLARVGRTDQAAPLLDRFLEAEPDDATLIEIRDRYGLGSILRLEDDPRTAGRVAELLNRLSAAARRNARREDQIRRSVRLLTGSPLQQSEALLRLDESGSYAVPFLLEALGDRDPGSPERALLVGNMGRLGRRAVPALVAALDAPDPAIAADVASALGRIGDRRALPFLVSEATNTADDRGPARDEANAAIRRLTGSPLESSPKPPARLLLDEARRYLTGAYSLPADQVELWDWEDGELTPRIVRPAEAEAILGQRFARRALDLDPGNREAAGILTALRVREVLQGVEPAPSPISGELPEDLAADLVGLGPEALADALNLALEAEFNDVSPVLIAAVGLTGDPAILASEPPSPLVGALSVPDRRIQLAAAGAIAALDPPRAFPGASRVVPTLARALDLGPLPEVVVVGGNAPLVTTIASGLQIRGLQPVTANSADEGFRRAAESAGVEALIVDPAFLRGPRDARDLLIDLRADARTAGLPVLLVLPIDPARAIARGEEYQLRQSEREPNDVPARASPISFVGRPRRARVDGRLSPDDRPPYGQPERKIPGEDEDDDEFDEDEAPAPQPLDISGDLFALGSLRPGDSLSVIAEPYPGSTLRPVDVVLWLERREGARGEPVARGEGSLAVTIEEPGIYDLRVQAATRSLYSYRALYTIDVTIYDYDVTIPGVTGTARLKVEQLAGQFDRVSVLAAPGNPLAVEAALYTAWDLARSRPIPAPEREAIAVRASDSLARLAGRPEGPFAADLARVAPQLQRSLANPVLAPSVAGALSAVPTVEAQRALADLVLDGSRPISSRVAAAEGLGRSVGRYGALLSNDQRPRLLRARDRAEAPELRAALDAVVEALRLAAVPAPFGGDRTDLGD